jgi:hypothetical protein
MKARSFFNKPGIVIAFIALILFVSCSKDEPSNSKAPTDYSQSEHWLSIPATAYDVDIFYYYPTAWQKVKDSDPIICEIDNPSMLKGAPEAFNRQATAFEPVGNIYAPFYRQDDAASTLKLAPDEQAKVVGGIPTTDATAAFDYYIKHFNNGRPFILAGHSQGAVVLSNLLAGYMKDNPEVYSKMIAAYVIGFPINAEYLADNPHLKYAEGPDDIGVIISYNTQSPDLQGTNPVLSGRVGIVINPISWTRDETVATIEEGLGSLWPVMQDSILTWVEGPQYADARIDIAKGVLICSTADEYEFSKIDSLSGWPSGVYHSFDFPFYYFNLRANAANRIQKWFKK